MKEDTSIRDALAESLRRTQPKLYASLAEMVARRIPKRVIMAQVRHAIAGSRRSAQEGKLTEGCCEAAIDRLREEPAVGDPFEETP
jgi:hypothetical protein